MTMVDVGRYFEGRDHSTVCNARANVQRWAEFDAPLWARVEIALTILGTSRTPNLPVTRTAALNRLSCGTVDASFSPQSLFHPAT
jgi:hypothetical protein